MEENESDRIRFHKLTVRCLVVCCIVMAKDSVLLDIKCTVGKGVDGNGASGSDGTWCFTTCFTSYLQSLSLYSFAMNPIKFPTLDRLHV